MVRKRLQQLLLLVLFIVFAVVGAVQLLVERAGGLAEGVVVGVGRAKFYLISIRRVFFGGGRGPWLERRRATEWYGVARCNERVVRG